uniref:Uncharacterized protein n=1 Tax=Aplanochytrium stocchinoi TaxID=215587 RepID=A0A7S3PFK9_9STRA
MESPPEVTVLVSSARVGTEILGKGMVVSLDATTVYQMLKKVVADYRIAKKQTENRNIPTSKKAFWKDLREYCRKRSSNWAQILWAGYPLYMISAESKDDIFLLLRMKPLAVVSGAETPCTLSHKQLHDLINKQFKLCCKECIYETQNEIIPVAFSGGNYPGTGVNGNFPLVYNSPQLGYSVANTAFGLPRNGYTPLNIPSARLGVPYYITSANNSSPLKQ